MARVMSTGLTPIELLVTGFYELADESHSFDFIID